MASVGDPAERRCGTCARFVRVVEKIMKGQDPAGVIAEGKAGK